MSKRILGLALAVAMLVTLFAGCAVEKEEVNVPGTGTAAATTSSSGDTAADTGKKLSVWVWPNDGNLKVFKDYVSPLVKEKTGYTVEYTIKPQDGGWSGYLNSCVAAIAAGEQLDLLGSAIEGQGFLLSKNLIDPLDDYIAKDPEGQKIIDGIAPLALDAFKANGKQYQIPISLEMMAIWYNLDMFKEAGIEPIDPVKGWTWDEFEEVAKKLTKDMDGGKRYGVGLTLGGAFMDYPWYLTNGSKMLNDDFTQATVNNDRFVQSLAFINKLVNVDKVAPMPDTTGGQVATMEEMFKAGRVAMTNIGGWAVAGMMKDMKGKYGVAPWPKPAGVTDGTSTVFGMCSFAIYTKSENKDAAWEALKILASAETSEKLWTDGGQSPAVKSVLASDIAKQQYPVGLGTWDEVSKNMTVIPYPVIFPEIEKIYSRHLNSMLNGQLTPEQAAKNMQDEMTTALSK